MKKFIKNYWWAIAIAVIVFLIKRNENKLQRNSGYSQTKVSSIEKKCSICGSNMKRYSHVLKNGETYAEVKCTNENCGHKYVEEIG